ncbi:MAG: PAS domain S-box protein, partial [Candidatus Cloacimonadota bacterium]
MKDKNKTKEQLINELKELRQQIAKLETDSKRKDEDLQESGKIYKLIADNTSDYIALLTFKGVLTYVSPSYKQLGYKPEELIGKSGLNMMHPEDKKRLVPLLMKYTKAKISKLLKLKQEGIFEHINFRFPDKSGKWHYIESTANLVENPEGKGYNILLISRDVTEYKLAEEALQG